MGLYALARQPWKILKSAYPGAGLVHATWRYEDHPHRPSCHKCLFPTESNHLTGSAYLSRNGGLKEAAQKYPRETTKSLTTLVHPFE